MLPIIYIIRKLPSRNAVRYGTAVLLLCVSLLCATVCRAAQPMTRIATIGDLHLDFPGNQSRFVAYLEYLSQYEIDVVVNIGDNSDNSQLGAYDTIEALIREHLGDVDVVWAIGNHDYDNISVADARSLLYGKTGQPYYYSVNVRGLRFIVLGTPDAREGTFERLGVLEDEQAAWLRNELQKAAVECAGLPIFVVSHYPFTEGSLDKASANQLMEILRTNKDVVFIAGHDHYAPSDGIREAVQVGHKAVGCTVIRAGSPYYNQKLYPDTVQGVLIERYYDRLDYTYIDITSKKAGDTATRTSTVQKVSQTIRPSRDIATVYVDGTSIDGIGRMVDGVCYVPLRAIMGALGAKPSDMYWDAKKKSTVIHYNGRQMTVSDGAELIMIGNELYPVDPPPKSIAGVTHVPLRFVLDHFGYKMEWNATTREAYVSKK